MVSVVQPMDRAGGAIRQHLTRPVVAGISGSCLGSDVRLVFDPSLSLGSHDRLVLRELLASQ